MEKAAKLFTAALGLWLLAGPCANSAGLSEGRTTVHGYDVASMRTCQTVGRAEEGQGGRLVRVQI